MADGVLAVELPVDVDVVALATLVPGLAPDALTADAAVALFRTLLAQALELDAHARAADESAAELERRDVELDQAYQDKEQATKDLEASLDLAQRELRAVRDERDRLGRPQKRVLSGRIPDEDMQRRHRLCFKRRSRPPRPHTPARVPSSRRLSTRSPTLSRKSGTSSPLLVVTRRTPPSKRVRPVPCLTPHTPTLTPACRGNQHTSPELEASPTGPPQPRISAPRSPL
jgi:hypothetical protein